MAAVGGRGPGPDVVLTSAGGLGLRVVARGGCEGAQPPRLPHPQIRAKIIVKLPIPRVLESAFFEISDVLFCAQESQNS